MSISKVFLHFSVCVCACACRIYLQVEKLEAVQLVEDVMGESGQLAAMHVQALQLLQAPECSTFQVPQQRVVAQVQLLQDPEVAESSGLNPCNVVSIQPKHLHGDLMGNVFKKRNSLLTGNISYE